MITIKELLKLLNTFKKLDDSLSAKIKINDNELIDLDGCYVTKDKVIFMGTKPIEQPVNTQNDLPKLLLEKEQILNSFLTVINSKDFDSLNSTQKLLLFKSLIDQIDNKK